jgi:uncharacterized protein (TIGR02453 family)
VAGAFKGFPPDLFEFLKDLKRNNRRDWFQANKDRYKRSVVEPMSAFISAMDTRLASVSDCFIADPRPHGGSMFRIYRDTRFSKDKSPYKTHASCHFRHMSGKDAHAPGFYMHFEPGDVFFGGGIWLPDNSVLRSIREAIVDDPDGWIDATRNRTFRKRFGSVEGDSLKRPPVGFDPDHPLIDDLKRKSFFAVREVDPQLATTPRFVGEVAKAFVALVPMMRFLTKSLGLSFDLDS